MHQLDDFRVIQELSADRPRNLLPSQLKNIDYVGGGLRFKCWYLDQTNETIIGYETLELDIDANNLLWG
jgi:hypothetical protein